MSNKEASPDTELDFVERELKKRRKMCRNYWESNLEFTPSSLQNELKKF